jgi:hypothetical protein
MDRHFLLKYLFMHHAALQWLLDHAKFASVFLTFVSDWRLLMLIFVSMWSTHPQSGENSLKLIKSFNAGLIRD